MPSSKEWAEANGQELNASLPNGQNGAMAQLLKDVVQPLVAAIGNRQQKHTQIVPVDSSDD